MDNFDNDVPSSKNFESAFKEKLSLKNNGKKSKISSSKSEDEIEEIFDSDLEVVEALLAKIYSRRKGRYKGKIPLIYFSYEEIGQIVVKCPNKEKKDEKKSKKYKRKKEFKN